MIDRPLDGWAERLTVIARAFPYPPTPNLAVAVSRRPGERPSPRVLRSWQVALLALVLILLGLLAVPAVRAEVAKFIQIGVVRIFVGQATPTPAATAAGLFTATPTPAGPRPLTATPQLTPTPIPSLLDSLNGETTLAGAQAGAGFKVLLPSYPSDLGPPDRVFLQISGAPMIVLVWVDQTHPDQARLALFEITPGSIGIEKSEFTKGVPPSLQNATVHGQPAAWTSGPYLVELKSGNIDYNRLIEGHVLIWVDNGLTYRLEMGSQATMAEAVKIAESLK
jgi:hypothetical protein